MPNWLYKLQLKELFMDVEPPGGDRDQLAIDASKECAARINALIKKIESATPRMRDKLGRLDFELLDVADTFEWIADGCPEEENDSPVEVFDRNLEHLYDIGNRGHRVWVE